MTTRRNLIAIVTGAAVTGGMIPPTTTARAANLDGELLAAYARWLPWEAERKRVVALALGDPTWCD